MEDCCESPGEKLRWVKLAHDSGLERTKLSNQGSVYGVESTCTTSEAVRGLSPKQKVSPSRRVLEHGQRERPKGLSLILLPYGRERQRAGREENWERRPPS